MTSPSVFSFMAVDCMLKATPLDIIGAPDVSLTSRPQPGYQRLCISWTGRGCSTGDHYKSGIKPGGKLKSRARMPIDK